jgi:hypothetical protein
MESENIPGTLDTRMKKVTFDWLAFVVYLEYSKITTLIPQASVNVCKHLQTAIIYGIYVSCTYTSVGGN